MSFFKRRRIFLDHAAGRDNPSSIYKEGVEAKRKLEEARMKIARVLACQPRDIVFTSGGTEADNLAVLGVFEACLPAGRQDPHWKPHIIISEYEHPAVREAAREAERRGAELSIVPAERIIDSIKENTVLVSLMYVNNETGAINPVPKIARHIAAERKRRGSKYPYIHTDASQAALYLPVDIGRVGADLMTLDASKVGGPKSTGLLVVRPNVTLRPLLVGGTQERGLRAGTENVTAVQLFADSLARAQEKREEMGEKAMRLKAIFLDDLARALPEAVINTPDASVPNIVSVSIPGQLHEFLAIGLDERGVAVSTGSSCKSNKDTDEAEALRFSFGPETTEHEVREAIRILSKILLASSQK